MCLRERKVRSQFTRWLDKAAILLNPSSEKGDSKTIVTLLACNKVAHLQLFQGETRSLLAQAVQLRNAISDSAVKHRQCEYTGALILVAPIPEIPEIASPAFKHSQGRDRN